MAVIEPNMFDCKMTKQMIVIAGVGCDGDATGRDPNSAYVFDGKTA